MQKLCLTIWDHNDFQLKCLDFMCLHVNSLKMLSHLHSSPHQKGIRYLIFGLMWGEREREGGGFCTNIAAFKLPWISFAALNFQYVLRLCSIYSRLNTSDNTLTVDARLYSVEIIIHLVMLSIITENIVWILLA